MAEAESGSRLWWLVEKLDAAEGRIEELEDEVADWRARARAAEMGLSDGQKDKLDEYMKKVAAYESTIRQIVNNPTMKREDVQGRLMTILQDQGAM